MKAPSCENEDPSHKPPRPISDNYEATRSSLVNNLKEWGDQKSWQTFFDTYWKLIFTVARRSGLSDAEANDAAQETILSVAKGIKSFEYDRSKGKFRGWLMRCASWKIQDQFRKRPHDRYATTYPAASGKEGGANIFDHIPDPKNDFIELWQNEWEENLRNVVMLRVRAKVPLKQYQIFDCYVLKGWTVEQVAEELGVSKASVYLARTRVGKIAKEETKHIENGRAD